MSPEIPLRTRLQLALVLAVLSAALYHRTRLEPSLPDGRLVEVGGDVARPGVHRASTLAAAVQAAGGEATGLPDNPLPPGSRVEVGDRVRVVPARDPLLLGLPVDLNRSGPQALEGLEGVGPSVAAAIVEDRARRGPFYAPEDLARVAGVGPRVVADVGGRVTVGDVGPRPPPVPLDLNTASVAALDRLPRVGPVTAAAIVADREANGPFSSVEALARVNGVGPVTLAYVRPHVRVESRD